MEPGTNSPLDDRTPVCFDTGVTPRSGAFTGHGVPPGGRPGPPSPGRGVSAADVLAQSPLTVAMRAAARGAPPDAHPDWQTLGLPSIPEAMTWLDTLDREGCAP